MLPLNLGGEIVDFGSYLKRLRINKGLSIHEVSRRTNVSQAYLSKLETGKTSNPSLDVLIKLSNLNGFSFQDLLKEEILSENENQENIINDILNERKRQDRIHPEPLELPMRFVTISEEIGEIAQALQDNDMESIYRELIDTAASCVRMAEEVLTKWENENDQ